MPTALRIHRKLIFWKKLLVELLYSGAVHSFHDAFWDSNAEAYCTYVVNGEKVHFSELMNALALYAGLVPQSHVRRVADLLSRQGCVYAVACSDYTELRDF